MGINVEKLNLPIIKGTLPGHRHLSMDEYLKFITLNLKYTLDIRALRKQKKLQAVNVLFSLK